jgi:UDPglucose 6-dehydrogenase
MAAYSTKMPHIQVTVVDLNEERIAAWNDEDLDNFPRTRMDKIVEKQGKKLILFYGCGKAIDELKLFLSQLIPYQNLWERKRNGSRFEIHRIVPDKLLKLPKTIK